MIPPAVRRALSLGTMTLCAACKEPSGTGTRSTTASVSVNLCAPPLWFAFQNEGAGWTAVTLNANQRLITFDASERVRLAMATSPNALVVVSLGANEVRSLSCADTGGTKHVTGKVANIGYFEGVGIAMGGAFASPGYTQPVSTSRDFQLSGVLDGAQDLVVASQIGPRVIVRRNVDVPGSTLMPQVDFASSEAVVLDSVALTFPGLSPAAVVVPEVTFFTRPDNLVLLSSRETSTSNAYFRSVPQLTATDYHALTVRIPYGDTTARMVRRYYTTSQPMSLEFGPGVATPVVTNLTATGPARYRLTLPVQPEYPALARALFVDTQLQVWVAVTAAFSGGGATWDLEIPDLASVPGFLASWSLSGSTAPMWYAEAWDAQLNVLFGTDVPAPGSTVRCAAKKTSPDPRIGSCAVGLVLGPIR